MFIQPTGNFHTVHTVHIYKIINDYTPFGHMVVSYSLLIATIFLQLKAVANAQEAVSSSDTIYQGYTVQGNARNVAYAIFYVPTIVLLILIFTLYARLTNTNFATRYIKKIAAAKKPYYQLFFSVYFVTAISCVIHIVSEVIGVFIWFDTTAAPATSTKFCIFVFLCSLTLIPAILIAKYHSNDLMTVHCFVCSRFPKISKCLLAWNFLLFTTILIWSLIPILILVFVNPIQTLSIVLLSLSILFLVCILITIWYTLFFPTGENQENQDVANDGTKGWWHKGMRWCLNLTIFGTLSSCFIFMAILLVYLLHKGVNTGGVLGFILALAPGTIIAIAAWFSGKILKWFEEEEDGEKKKEKEDGAHAQNYQPGNNELHQIKDDTK